jgi:hypothetical protein
MTCFGGRKWWTVNRTLSVEGFSYPHPVKSGGIGMIAAILVRMIAASILIMTLGGCDTGEQSSRAPGSLTIYLHGRLDAGIGASTR